MQDIVIFGVGGFGREVHELVEDVNDADRTYDILGFLDGDKSLHGTMVHDLPVLGDASWLQKHPETAVALGVGNTRAKTRIVQQLRDAGASFPSLIHPNAVVGRRVEIGEGSIICAGTIVTTDVRICDYVTMNIDITIGHDSTIRNYVTIAPGAHVSGNVDIGIGSDIGTGAVMIQGVTIGEWSVVGAGSAIVRNIPPNVTAVGVPASVIKEREAGWHLA